MPNILNPKIINLRSLILNIVFGLQVLLAFLLIFQDRIALPTWLQVAGRLHPMVLHLPIGFLTLAFLLMILKNEFKKEAFRRVMLVVLLVSSLSTSIAALFGFFLSREGSYGEAIFQHKTSGVLLSFLCYILLLLFIRDEKLKLAFYLTGAITIGLLVFTGHTGGNITHGENYVLAPMRSSFASSSYTDPLTVYGAAVVPILEQKCFSCHNESKAKGKLVLTSVEALKKGGKNGRIIEAGKPLESRMIKYIHLPVEEEDHMPPKEKPQLTTQEISLLEKWIQSGASFDMKLSELKSGDSLQVFISSLTRKRRNQAEPTYEFEAVSEETIKKLNTPFRVVFPLYQNSPALQVDFFVKEMYKTNALEELKEIKDQLVVVNLPKMPITDEALKIIGTFKNLERLNINFTQVKGQGLRELQSLKKLQSLSLSGIEVEAKDLEPVLSNPSLKEVFIWNTKISESEKVKLASQYPKITFATSEFVNDKILRLSKPIVANEGVIKENELVVIKHAMPGVSIRYTLDGSKPDSVSGKLYNSPFKLYTASNIRAIGCMPGWYCSEVFKIICFAEGHKPLRAELVYPPDKQYPGEGAASLIDERKGFIDVLKEPSWLGFREQPFVGIFDFGENPRLLQEIVISYAEDIGSYAFPPVEVEVYGGKNRQEWKLIKAIKVDQPTDYRPRQLEALPISLNNVSYSFYKVVAKPLNKLPKWHSGKGKKGWFFVDEVFFY